MMPAWPLYIVGSALLLGLIKRCPMPPHHPRSIRRNDGRNTKRWSEE